MSEIILKIKNIPPDLLKYFESVKIERGAVLRIPTKPNKLAHFATFPPTLVAPMIKSGCPREVCVVCGVARERIVEKGKSLWEQNKNIPSKQYPMKNDNYKRSGPEYKKNKELHPDKFIGWSDCGCGEGFKPGVVLDIFSGIGTTAKKAFELGRDYIGFELSEEYCKLSEKYLSMTKNKRLTDF